MNFSKFYLIPAIVCSALTVWGKTSFEVLPTKAGGVYKVGETVEFSVKAVECDEPLFYEVSYDHAEYQPIQPVNGKTVSIKAEKPGFIMIRVRPKIVKGGIFGLAGAVVEPEKLRAVPNKPADFDQFWDSAVSAVRQGELKVTRRELDAGLLNAGTKGWEVTLERGGVTASGYLIMPLNAKAKSLPAIAGFNGAGAVTAMVGKAREDAALNAIAFNANFHGAPNVDRPSQQDIKKLQDKFGGFQYVNTRDRDLYPLKNIYLRTVIVMDYLQTLPEYDGKNLIVHGSSLGGAQAIVAAAFTPQITLCISNVTAFCDQRAGDVKRRPGWPRLLLHTKDAPVGYFDIVNFAPRVKCKTIMALGFVDHICPGATVYGAYAALGSSDKKMYHRLGGTHGHSVIPGEGSAGEKDKVWMDEYLRKRGVPSFSAVKRVWHTVPEGKITYFANEQGKWDYPRGMTVVAAGNLKKIFDLTAEDLKDVKKAYIKMHIGIAERKTIIPSAVSDGLDEKFIISVNGHQLTFETADPRFYGYTCEDQAKNLRRKHDWAVLEIPALWLKAGENTVVMSRVPVPGKSLNDVVYWSVDIHAENQASEVSYNNGRSYRAMTPAQPAGKGEFMVRLGLEK